VVGCNGDMGGDKGVYWVSMSMRCTVWHVYECKALQDGHFT
jgi:hypothetical protein